MVDLMSLEPSTTLAESLTQRSAANPFSTMGTSLWRLSKDEFDGYLASGEWRGKAGGYAIQGLGGRDKPASLVSSPTAANSMA